MEVRAKESESQGNTMPKMHELTATLAKHSRLPKTRGGSTPKTRGGPTQHSGSSHLTIDLFALSPAVR